MVQTKDKAGKTVYITYINDCCENAGGFYCETYSDEDFGHKIDDFCVHPEDCNCENEDAVEEYIRHFYDDMVLDLDYTF